MAQPGTTLGVLKAAVISELQSRLPNVAYDSPVDAQSIIGEDGSGDAIWWSDDAEANVEVKVITGSPAWFDETYNLTLIIQSLGRDTDADQSAVDSRAVDLLGEIIGILATDPTAGAVDTSKIQTFTALPIGWRYAAGVLGTTTKRGARFELDIQVMARLTLAAS